MKMIYCHGRPVFARYLCAGWAMCACGKRIRVVA